jgi:O-antigen/teichoic acid export membrane protein
MSEVLHSDAVLAKTAKGAGWVIGWRMATRILGLISTLVLVRLLQPADFGLVALSASFAQAIDAFSMIGVEDAVIRERAPTREVYDTGFTLSMLRGVLTGTLIAALAYPAAEFFSEPRLAEIVLVLGMATFLDGFANIGTVDFRRNFTFDKEFRFWILPRVLAIIAAITTAFVFRTYWALVVGIMSQRVLRVVFSYVMHPYRPRLSLRAWRHLVGYSLWTWATGVAVLVRDRADSILIGRLLDPTHVGIYSVGFEMASLPTTELVEPLCRASFSGFTAARHSGLSPTETYLRIVSGAVLLTLPAGLGISLIADPIVKLAFGSGWVAATPLVQVLGVAGCATVLGNIGATLFRAHGRLTTTFRITLASVCLRVALLLAGISYDGLVGAGIGAGLAIAAEQLLYVVTIFRRFDLRLADLLDRIWRGLLAAVAMAGVLSATGLGWTASAATTPAGYAADAVCGALLGAAVYVGVLLGSWLISGEPPGAEADAVALVRKLQRRWVG